MKKLLLSLTLLTLFAFNSVNKVEGRDCQTSEADNQMSGGYVSGGKLYLWKRAYAGGDIIIKTITVSDSGHLRTLATSNGWTYVE